MTTLIPKFDLKDGGATPTGAVNRPIYEKLSDTISVKDFGAVGDGTTDDSTAINNALSSGFLIIDGAGDTYKINSSVTIPANITLQNINLVAGTAGINMVLVNNFSKILNSKLTGTGTLSIVERGIYPATNNVTDVTLNVECANLTIGIQAQPTGGGTAYADAPKRWSGNLKFTNIAGTTGNSEGYGLLLSPAYHCQFNIISNSPNARHIIYLSAGASYNQITANITGCSNYASQIAATSLQNDCQYNTLNLTCYNLTESVSGQGGAIAIVGKANYNTVTANVTGDGLLTQAIRVEGNSGGPYPFGNKIVNSNIYGQFIGASVINTINADSTLITNNVLNCYSTSYVIGLRYAGTNGATQAGYVQDNIINCFGASIQGIYAECTAQPCYIGLNSITNNASALRVLDSTGGQRQGYSKITNFSGVSGSVAGSSSADITATLNTSIQITGRRTNVVLTGSSVSFLNSPICIVGVAASSSETQSLFRLYNGSASAQTFNYEGFVQGD